MIEPTLEDRLMEFAEIVPERRREIRLNLAMLALFRNLPIDEAEVEDDWGVRGVTDLYYLPRVEPSELVIRTSRARAALSARVASSMAISGVTSAG